MSPEQVQSVAQKIGHAQLMQRIHTTESVEKHYQILPAKLGSGINGDVLKGICITTKQPVAIKPFRFKALQYGDKRRLLEQELEVFLSLDHPHVCRLLEVYESELMLHLVMECMEGGEVLDRVTSQRRFSEHDAAEAMSQMLLAVNYLHNNSIVHGDIKPENFLYDRKDGDHLKLIDFGFSRVWDQSEQHRHVTNSMGTLDYVAPEALEEKKNVCPKSDVWSLGVVAYVLLTGDMPFHAKNNDKLMEEIRKGRYEMKQEVWDSISPDAADFVKSLLRVDVQNRLSAQAALDHRWITGRDKLQTEVTPEIANALCLFGRQSSFRKCCMNSMAWLLSNEERAKVRNYFLSMDTSKEGTITLKELKDVMINKLQMDCRETEDTFDALDSNGDAAIHYSDFLAAMVNTRISLHEDLLRKAFKSFDVDSSGYITVENMQEVLGDGFEEEKVKSMVKEADLAKDGKISFPEFTAYIMELPLDQKEQAAWHKTYEHALAKISRETTASTTIGEPTDKLPSGSTWGSEKPLVKEKKSGKSQPCCTVM
jgi:calcium-dependent protein kinase